MTFARSLCGTDLNQDYSDSLFLIEFIYPAAATLKITMAFLWDLRIRYLNSSKDNTYFGKTFEGYAHFCRKQPESYIYILGKLTTKVQTDHYHLCLWAQTCAKGQNIVLVDLEADRYSFGQSHKPNNYLEHWDSGVI